MLYNDYDDIVIYNMYRVKAPEGARVIDRIQLAIYNIEGNKMFTIAFRDGTHSEKECEGVAVFNEEYLRDSYKQIYIRSNIGQTFMDFVSLSGDIRNSGHPYLALDEDTAENVTADSWFLVQLRKFLDLGIENEAFFTVPSLMYFLHITGLQIPAFYHELIYKRGKENTCLEDLVPVTEGMDHFEHSMRAFLASGNKVFQDPLMTYECESIEDACIASLHFLITHKFHIRKCKNCGRYFVAYLRSDTEYCDRRSPYNANKTCKEDGPKRTFDASVNADTVKKTLQKIDIARRMRVSRNPDNADIKQEYEVWKKSMRKMRDQYYSGGITAEYFLDWLEAHKRYNQKWKTK